MRCVIVQLNAKGEVADFLDVSQFVPGKSAFECVAYAASLIRYAGLPGKGPTGTALQASNLAQYWYGREEGGNDAPNANGMSLDALYQMLAGMGLRFQEYATNVEAVKSALAQGMPVILCGAETGMHDLALGGAVPYSWRPSGNHAIVVSGIAADGNLLVHDTANVDAHGVRPGPRVYDASRLQIVSATAVHLFEEIDDLSIDIHSPHVADYFEEKAADRWHCKKTGHDIAYAMLSHYKVTDGLLTLGLPISGEIPIEQVNPPLYARYAGHGITVQFFERGVLVYDLKHLIDSPPGSGDVYRAHLYLPGAVGTDPRLWTVNLSRLLQGVK